MKRIIFTIILILAALASYSQDGFNQTEQYYNEIEKSVIGIDTDQAVQFALDITENMEEQYSYLRRIATPYKLTVIYQLSSITDINYRRGDNLTLVFKVNEASANEDLFADKADVLKITGNRSAIIPIWISFFLKNATEKQVLENYKYRVLLNPNNGFHFRLINKGKYWIIENRSRVIKNRLRF